MRFYHDDCNTELDRVGRCPKCLYRHRPDAQCIYGKHDTVAQEVLSPNALEQIKYWKNLAESQQKIIDEQNKLIQAQASFINII